MLNKLRTVKWYKHLAENFFRQGIRFLTMITIVACLHFCVRPAHLNLQIKFFESAMFGREHQVGNVLHVMYVHNRVL